MNNAPNGKARILLLDHTPRTLFVLRYALQNAGLMVFTADSGAKALSVVEEEGERGSAA